MLTCISGLELILMRAEGMQIAIWIDVYQIVRLLSCQYRSIASPPRTEPGSGLMLTDLDAEVRSALMPGNCPHKEGQTIFACYDAKRKGPV